MDMGTFARDEAGKTFDPRLVRVLVQMLLNLRPETLAGTEHGAPA
jgi:hypothetical protein